MRKSIFKTILILLLINSTNVFAQKNVNICYIANAGFLVNIDSTKILFDALFGGFEANWCDLPSNETISKLKQSLPPFDNIDIIFISHEHRDHFNAEIVINHCLNDSNCTIVCPNQVKDQLALHEQFPKISNKIFAFTPNFYNDTSTTINGINICIYRLEHIHAIKKDSETGKEINQNQDIENLGFLIELNGLSILNCGDSNPLNEKEFANYDFAKKSIDIAFLERRFLSIGNSKGINVIENYINPQNIILTQFEPNKYKEYWNIIEEEKKRLPKVWIFEKPMDNKTITIK